MFTSPLVLSLLFLFQADDPPVADAAAPPPPAAHFEPTPIAPAAAVPRFGPDSTEPMITFEVRSVDLDNIDWRTSLHGKSKLVSHQGGATVWTLEADELPPFLKGLQKDPRMKMIQAPKVSAFPQATATILNAQQRHYVASVERLSDGPPGRGSAVAFKPEVGSIRDGFHAILSGRKLDQGVLVNAAIDESRLIALRTVTVRDGVTGEKTGNGPTNINAQYQVPEVVSTKVEGEWLIPKNGALLVSLGAHTEPGAEGKPAELRERLVIVAADSLVPLDPQDSQPPMPARPADPSVRPAMFAPAEPAPLGISVPAAHVVAPIPAPKAIIGLPVPPLPERAVPQPINPDGTPAELPPLPDENAHPASMEPPTSEPMPSPQKAADKAGDTQVQAKEVWPLSLREAITIGLDNSEDIRVLESKKDEPLVIAPVKDDHQEIDRFRTVCMEHARGIEQQYWALVERHLDLWARETLVSTAEDVLKAAKSRNLRTGISGAEASLEKYRLDLVTATANLITTERQLRNILGLKPSDNRRIVPVTEPTMERLPLDCVKSRSTMLENHPDVVRIRALVEAAERNLASAQPGVHVFEAKKALQKQRDLFDQTIHQTTRALMRFHLEAAANYREFRRSDELSMTILGELEGERRVFGNFEMDAAAIDRLLKRMNKWADAYVRRSQALTAYNISLANAREAEGTLLDNHSIVIAEEAKKAKAVVRIEVKTALPLSLREALALGFKNSHFARVDIGLNDVGPLVVAPVKDVEDVERFRSESMELARSIERRYWELSRLQKIRSARETHVKTVEKALTKERERPSTASASNLADAEGALEQARLRKVDAIDAVFEAERKLLTLIGLESAESRNVVAGSEMTDKKVVLEWDKSVSSMLNRQSDIVRNRSLVREAEGRLAKAEALEFGQARRFRNREENQAPRPDEAESNLQRAKSELSRQQKLFVQTVHQTTHTLARFFLEADSNFAQLQIARRMVEAANQRVEAQSVYYEKGVIGVNRLVQSMANLEAAQEQAINIQTGYNLSLCGVHEADGTLLDRDSVLVAGDVKVAPVAARAAMTDPAISQAAFHPAMVEKAAGSASQCVKDAAAESVDFGSTETKVLSYQLPLGGGSTMKVRVRIGRTPAASRVIGETIRQN